MSAVAGAAITAAVLIPASPATAQDVQIACGDISALRAGVANTQATGSGERRLILAAGCTYTFDAAAPGETQNALPVFVSTATHLIIEGNGATLLRPPGSAAFRFLETRPSTRVTLRNLTMRGGLTHAGSTDQAGAPGGAILNNGTMTLEGVTLTGNQTGAGGNGSNVVRSNGNSGQEGGRGGAIHSGGDLTIVNSTISHNRTGNGGNGGNAIANAGPGGSSGRGGGVSSAGTLTIVGSTIEFNETGDKGSPGDALFGGPPGSYGRGGGVHALGGTTITQSLLRGNTTRGWGGAVAMEPASSRGSLSLSNSTILDNVASRGGGIYVSNSTAQVSHTTITGNTAHGTGDFDHGGDAMAWEYGFYGLELTFNNSIIHDNGAPGGECSGPFFNGSGTWSSIGGLLTGTDDASCPADIRATPLLGPLADNGGPTMTRALLSGSPAIDAGNAGTCSAIDQRGTPRSGQGAGCDIGAFEKATAPSVSAITGATKTLVATERPYSVTATGVEPLEYRWSVFGVSATIAGPTSADPVIVFTSPGTATVQVIVRSVNANDAQTVRTMQVRVGPADNRGPLLALRDAPGHAPEGSSVTYTFVASDPEGNAINFVPGYPKCGEAGELLTSTVDNQGGSFTCHFPDGDAVSHIDVQLEDEYGTPSPERGTGMFVREVAPHIVVTGPDVVDEGAGSTLYEYTIHDPGPDPLVNLQTTCLTLGEDGTISKLGGSDTFTGTVHSFSGSFRCLTPNGPETGGARVTASGAEATKTFTVRNIAPTVTLSGPTQVDEYDGAVSYRYDYTITDPGIYDEPLGVGGTASCGEGGLLVPPLNGPSIHCSFLHPSTVSIVVADRDGARATASLNVGVTYSAPPITYFGTLSNPTVEGSTVTYSVTGTSATPGRQFIVTPPAGCAETRFEEFPSGYLAEFSCHYPDGPVVVERTVTVTDADDPTSVSTATLFQIVLNAPPTLHAEVSPVQIREGEQVTVELTGLTDPGPDTVTQWIVNWGDGTSDTYLTAEGPKTHVYGLAGNPQITIDVVDEDGHHADVANPIGVTVQPVTARVTYTDPPTSVTEGSTSTIEFTIDDPSANTHEIYSADCGWDAQTGAINTASNFSLSGRSGQFDCTWANGPSTPQVGVRLVNASGALSAPARFTTTVTNVAPSLTYSAGNPTTVEESETAEYQFDFTVTDPGNDPIDILSGYWDGTTVRPVHLCGENGVVVRVHLDPLEGGEGSGWVRCRFPNGPSQETLQLRVSDPNSLVGTAELAVTVSNAPPIVTVNQYGDAHEGWTTLFVITASDPGPGVVTISDLSCGAGTISSISSPSWTNLNCAWADGPVDTAVTGTATDVHGAVTSFSFPVSVRNIAPTITLSGPPLYEPGADYTLTLGPISDPGGDTVNRWNVHWGDGTTESFTAAVPSPVHTYSGTSDRVIVVDLEDEDGIHPAAGTLTIRVPDVTAPVITQPPSLTVEATHPGGAEVDYVVDVTDDRDDVTAQCTPFAPGSVFPLGETVVACTAHDFTGNAATPVSFTVTVVDTTVPLLTAPVVTQFEASSADGAVVHFAVTAHDLVDGAVDAECTPAAGTLLPLGPTTVTCSAEDSRGNTGTLDFTLEVVDTTGPVISGPATLPLEATGPTGAIFSGDGITAVDAVDGPTPFDCLPPEGTVLGFGSSSVTCYASDSSENVGVTTFAVEVADTSPPVISVPTDLLLVAPGPTGAVAVFDPATAVDVVDGPVSVSCDRDSGTVVPVGVTTVTCVAEDSRGNRGSETFTITVTYTPPPDPGTPGGSDPGTGVPPGSGTGGTGTGGTGSDGAESETPPTKEPGTDTPGTDGPGTGTPGTGGPGTGGPGTPSAPPADGSAPDPQAEEGFDPWLLLLGILTAAGLAGAGWVWARSRRSG